MTEAEIRIKEKELDLRKMELELERMRLDSGAGSDGDELTTSEGKGGRFRLLAGGHIDPNGKEFKAGQIVTAANDLSLKFGTEKFQRLSVIHETSDDGTRTRKAETKLDKKGRLADVRRVADAKQKVGDDERTRRELGEDAAGISQISGHGVPVGDHEDGDHEDGDDGNVLAAGGTLPDVDEGDGGIPQDVADADPGPGGFENLEGMTVADLKDLAESEEIDLGGATRKMDIIVRIRAAKNTKK